MNGSIGGEKTMGVPGDGGGAGDFALRAGEVLGPYRIVRPLGRGGMGEVYLAEHGHIGTRVALKIIRSEFSADPGFVERFQREARLTARLRHPHIVPCRDAGVDRGIPWLAMDYIEGPRGEPMDLHELLAERRTTGKLFDEDEAIAVGLQICDALAYAHCFRDDGIPAGILHRDLKPANILVGPDTRLYVADFGLARIMGQGFERSVIEQSVSAARSLGDQPTMGAPKVVTSSDRVGTFDYMSPEQREGREADARSDVFALGAILYELLTGRKVAGVPLRPSKARPGLNPVWDGIVYERCLTADPSGRYGSAAELKAAILAATAVGQPALSVQPSGGEVPNKAAKAARGRGRAWIGYAAVAALLVIMVLGVIRALRYEPGRQPEEERVADVEPPAPSVIPPPSAPAIPAGAIRVLATVPPEAEAYFQGLEKRIRIGSNPWMVVRVLPHVESGLPCAPAEVEIAVAGFEGTGGSRSTATVANGRTADVSFALSPLPARLTLTCNATSASVQVGTGGPPIRLAEGLINAPALATLTLTVSAPGYAPQIMTLDAMAPGRAYAKDVQLKKRQFPDMKGPWENSLGMKFVPVPGTEVLFCIWETRNKDYRAFKADYDSGSYEGQTLNGDLQPVVNVSWDDAKAFCAWLTEKERRLGRISSDQSYRLPSDWEWSVAVGLSEAKGGSPEDKAAKTPDAYPWGNQWPPPSGADNYGQAMGVDSYEVTAPVGSFAAHGLGLYDMGGNVEEWCEDWYAPSSQSWRVLRGGSWFLGGREFLLSSSRGGDLPGRRLVVCGFRVVLSSSSPSQPPVAPIGQPQSASKNERAAGDTAEIDLGGGITMTLCWIPPGEFVMGSPADETGRDGDETQHRVTIPGGYWMGKTEVTQRQYQQLIGETPSSFKNAGPNAPVESVDWSQAKAFCDRLQARLPPTMRGLSARLPTEAEWEYACRAGTTTALHNGKPLTSTDGRSANLDEIAWYYENSGDTTHPVGRKKANAWGLHDMLGNVWEWCGDWYGTYPSGSVTDPTGMSSGSGRVNRGGSWLDVDGVCSSANRDSDDPGGRGNYLGFRVVVGRCHPPGRHSTLATRHSPLSSLAPRPPPLVLARDAGPPTR